MPFRRALVSLAAVAATLGLAACGGGSTSNAASGTGANGGQRRPQLTATQQACLKKEGVTLPGPRNGSGPPNGQPPAGGYGGPPGGGQGRPPGGFDPNSPQALKRRAAMQKCGVNFGPRGGGPRTPPATTTTTTAS